MSSPTASPTFGRRKPPAQHLAPATDLPERPEAARGLRRSLVIALLVALSGLVWLQRSRPLRAARPAWVEPLPDQPAVDLEALPGVVVQPYEIQGSTYPQLRAALERQGPDRQVGEVYYAHTRWWMDWRWPSDAAGRCDLSKTRVTFRATVQMPRWRDPDTGSSALREHWRRFYAATTRHEYGHLLYPFSQQDRVRRAILAGPCETANARALEETNVIGRHDADYDLATGHGRTQGAIF